MAIIRLRFHLVLIMYFINTVVEMRISANGLYHFALIMLLQRSVIADIIAIQRIGVDGDKVNI